MQKRGSGSWSERVGCGKFDVGGGSERVEWLWEKEKRGCDVENVSEFGEKSVCV